MQPARAPQCRDPPDRMGDIGLICFKLIVLPLIRPHPSSGTSWKGFTGNAHSNGAHVLSFQSSAVLWSRSFTVPESRSGEETLTLCLCITLSCQAQQCDNLLSSPSVGNTSPVIAELRRVVPPAWLALQQILINVCYPLNYLFFPDMLLTFFPSIQ